MEFVYHKLICINYFVCVLGTGWTKWSTWTIRYSWYTSEL